MTLTQTLVLQYFSSLSTLALHQHWIKTGVCFFETRDIGFLHSTNLSFDFRSIFNKSLVERNCQLVEHYEASLPFISDPSLDENDIVLFSAALQWAFIKILSTPHLPNWNRFVFFLHLFLLSLIDHLIQQYLYLNFYLSTDQSSGSLDLPKGMNFWKSFKGEKFGIFQNINPF